MSLGRSAVSRCVQRTSVGVRRRESVCVGVCVHKRRMPRMRRDVVGVEVRSYALGWLRKVALEMHAELAEEIRRVDPRAQAHCRCAACGVWSVCGRHILYYWNMCRVT